MALWPYISWMNLRTEPDVIDFLRAALAEQPRPVTKVEASARAAGLLNEGQRITHAKAFKRAKRTLAIRSLHAGFGARSQWLWELPRENEAWANAEPQAAPVLDEPVPRIPSDWSEGVARLNPDRPPSDVPRLRWRQFVNDCHTFLSASE